MNSEEIEQFIALIARENKVVIGANDPIAMQLTAMRFVLLELADAQRSRSSGSQWRPQRPTGKTGPRNGLKPS